MVPGLCHFPGPRPRARCLPKVRDAAAVTCHTRLPCLPPKLPASLTPSTADCEGRGAAAGASLRPTPPSLPLAPMPWLSLFASLPCALAGAAPPTDRTAPGRSPAPKPLPLRGAAPRPSPCLHPERFVSRLMQLSVPRTRCSRPRRSPWARLCGQEAPRRLGPAPDQSTFAGGTPTPQGRTQRWQQRQRQRQRQRLTSFSAAVPPMPRGPGALPCHAPMACHPALPRPAPPCARAHAPSARRPCASPPTALQP
jgi:hypothetical protein